MTIYGFKCKYIITVICQLIDFLKSMLYIYEESRRKSRNAIMIIDKESRQSETDMRPLYY